MKKLLYSLLFSLLAISCIETPVANNIPKVNHDTLSIPFPKVGAIILCEGLWNYNNSDIYLYDEQQDKVINSYFKNTTNKFLGDIVSDVDLVGDGKVIFTSTGTQQIILMDYTIPALIGQMNISYERAAPRSIVIVGDRYYYTDLFRDEVRSGTISSELTEPDKQYNTGPAPEDIEYFGEELYIANSGYGDYRKNELNAGTLQIINTTTGSEKFVEIGPNLVKLSINKNEKYIACGYLNTPSEVDKGKAGGIKFVDMETHEIVRELELMDFADVKLNEKTGRIYYLTKKGLYTLPSLYSKALPYLLLENTSSDIWSSISLDEENNTIWICNSKNYQTDGEAIKVSADGNIIKRIEVGKIPREVVIYREGS